MKASHQTNGGGTRRPAREAPIVGLETKRSFVETKRLPTTLLPLRTRSRLGVKQGGRTRTLDPSRGSRGFNRRLGAKIKGGGTRTSDCPIEEMTTVLQARVDRHAPGLESKRQG